MAKWNWTEDSIPGNLYSILHTGDRSFTGDYSPDEVAAELNTAWQEDQGADQAPAKVFSQETEKERIVCR